MHWSLSDFVNLVTANRFRKTIVMGRKDTVEDKEQLHYHALLVYQEKFYNLGIKNQEL